MKKTKKISNNEVPQEPEKQATNIRNYFTKEVNEKMAEVSFKQMENLMKEMIDTPYWIALLKYTNMRMSMLDSLLRTTNPVKNPHQISWTQGAMAGLCDIEGCVIELNAQKEGEEENKSPETEGKIIG